MVTLVSTDIEGSTKLLGELDPSKRLARSDCQRDGKGRLGGGVAQAAKTGD
jgi:hypothetical protein